LPHTTTFTPFSSRRATFSYWTLGWMEKGRHLHGRLMSGDEQAEMTTVAANTAGALATAASSRAWR